MMTSQQALKLAQHILGYWGEYDSFTAEHTFINENGDIEIHSISLCGSCIGSLSNEFRLIQVSISVQFPNHIRVVCNL